MSSHLGGSSGSEMIFVELLQALSKSEDRLAVLGNFIQRYPEREEEIRELADFNSALDHSCHQAPAAPAQLGEFRIERLIKVGGMGEIYEAYHERLDRRVALKIVHRGWTNSCARERFAREQHILAKLHHSNIVPIHSGGEDGPIQYFTMPFIRGSALNHVVEMVASLSSSDSSRQTPSVPEIANHVLQHCHRESVSNATHSRCDLDAADSNAVPRLRLSRSYFTSVAQTMIDVAGAVEYAHRAGVLHRDLKPANVMIEASGHCWVIDFGLAARLKATDKPSSSSHAGDALFGSLTNELGGGTYNYMAPERWQGKPADPCTDVFSLGAILYELLCLRQAYSGNNSSQIKHKILHGLRTPAKKYVMNLPADLTAIADKAMSADPNQRYSSAATFAEDLKRWLQFAPITARPAMPWTRLKLWTRRQPAIALAVTIAVLATLGILWAVIGSYQSQVAAAQRLSRIQLIHQALLGEHTLGWSQSAWDSVRSLAKQDADIELKALAAATREGVDAQTINRWDYSSSHLAYNPSGTKLLMVKFLPEFAENQAGQSTLRSAQIWDSATHRLFEFPQSAHDKVGPVIFPNDDKPLQLVWDKKESQAISLWNLAKQSAAVRMECSFELIEAPISWSVTPSGSMASALVKRGNRRCAVCWDVATGKRLAELDTNASVIELSPDGKLLASACPGGCIEIWSLEGGRRIASLSENHTEINCFAWAQDRLNAIDSEESGWLLAAGSSGGDLTIWDVARQTARSHCIGSCFEVFALAFSPDGTTLASAGRDQPLLWNVADGKLLLRLSFHNTMTAIVYSSSGDKLAVGSQTAWGNEGGTTEFKVQELRGQQVLRGLRSKVTQVRFSSHNRYVAALTDNWQLAIWDLRLHRLLHVFQVPVGVYAQSAGLALDDVNGQVAVVAGSEARIWDITSGVIRKKITLPPGFLDSIVFQDANTLLSARQESVQPEFPPVGRNASPDITPRVCRIRNLLSTEAEKPILTIPDFKRSAAFIALTSNGKHVLIEGYYEGGEKPENRLIRLFSVPDGSKCWEKLSDAKGAQAHRIQGIDPLGHVIIMAHASMQGRMALVDLRTGIELRDADPGANSVGADASLVASVIADDDIPGKHEISLVDHQKKHEVVRLGLHLPVAEGIAISIDGQYVAYGCFDGSVVVADLWNLQQKLAEVGLH